MRLSSIHQLLLASLLFLAACEQQPSSPPSGPPAPPFNIGDLNAAGRLIFWSIGDTPFVLTNDEYGVVLYNDGTDKAPVAKYILACQSTREIINTSDFNEFKQAIAKIPQGSLVSEYGTCSVPRWYGLPGDIRLQFDKVFADAGLKIEEDPKIVCYCTDFR